MAGSRLSEIEATFNRDPGRLTLADLRHLIEVGVAAEAFWRVYYYDIGGYVLSDEDPEFSCIKTEDDIRLEPLEDALTKALSLEIEDG